MTSTDFPRSEWRIAWVMVGLLVSFFLFHAAARYFFESTVYAPGYTWLKFQSIRPGMTPAEVDSILGPPLKRVAWFGLSDVSFYTDQATITDNFYREWVVWENGKVAFVIDDYWED